MPTSAGARAIGAPITGDVMVDRRTQTQNQVRRMIVVMFRKIGKEKKRNYREGWSGF